jgi:hypothetical protein
MTAAALGFAASYIEKDQPIQFDMDPLDVRDQGKTRAFNDAVSKLDKAIADYLQRSGRAPKDKLHAETSPPDGRHGESGRGGSADTDG